MSSSNLTPIKSKRLDEKTSLQTLNGRLELYVQRVQEMEDTKSLAERELETIRARMQHDMDHLKARLSAELEETRKKLEDALEQKARLQVLEQEQHVELVKLRAQVKDLSEYKALSESLSIELTKEKEHAQSSKETLSVQTTQLQSARRRLKELERENRGLELQYSDVSKELAHLRHQSNEFALTRDTEITSIRKEMHAKHQEALLQWKADAEERLQKAETEVRSYFEGIVSGMKTQVVELSEELETVKLEADRTSQDYEESLKIRQALTDKVATLEREYREHRAKFKEDKKHYELTLERMRQAKTTKESEFNDLMDVKIALDAEISAYRRILDREESRVGIPTPKDKGSVSNWGKRKSISGGWASSFTSSSKKSKSIASIQSESSNMDDVSMGFSSKPVKIVGLDLEKDQIVLENTSGETVALGSWEVRGKAENQVFRFPANYNMRPYSKMTVYSSKRNKKNKEECKKAKEKTNEDSFLATKFSLDPQGDFVVLLTDEGMPVSLKSEGLAADEVRKLENSIKAEMEGGDVPTSECGIM